jgi:hypothetical protein
MGHNETGKGAPQPPLTRISPPDVLRHRPRCRGPITDVAITGVAITDLSRAHHNIRAQIGERRLPSIEVSTPARSREDRRIDGTEGVSYKPRQNFNASLNILAAIGGAAETSRETDLSAEQISPQAATRLSRPHGHQRWPQGFGGQARARAQAPERLMRAVASSNSFPCSG